MSKGYDLSKAEQAQKEVQERLRKADVEADKIEMTAKDREVLDFSMKAEGQGKSTGFDFNHAKKFKSTGFRTLNGNIDGLEKRDAHRAYKLISFNEFRSNGFRDSRGWVPLTIRNKTVENFPAPSDEYGVQVQGDGFWHVGDRIWAYKPIEEYAHDRFRIQQRTQVRNSGVSAEFKNQVKKLSEKNTEEFGEIEDITKRI